MTDHDQQTEDLKKLMIDIKAKSEDDFEKNITLITAGTLVLSLTFLEKVVSIKDASHIGVLMWAWICLAVTLLVNLGSHLLASWFIDKSYVEVSTKDKLHVQKRNRRNWRMRGINILTVLTLMLGISLLITFATKNAYTMAEKQQGEPIQPHTNDHDLLRKGRTLMPGIASDSTGSDTTQSNPQTPSTGSTEGSISTGSTQAPKED